MPFMHPKSLSSHRSVIENSLFTSARNPTKKIWKWYQNEIPNKFKSFKSQFWNGLTFQIHLLHRKWQKMNTKSDNFSAIFIKLFDGFGEWWLRRSQIDMESYEKSIDLLDFHRNINILNRFSWFHVEIASRVTQQGRALRLEAQSRKSADIPPAGTLQNSRQEHPPLQC